MRANRSIRNDVELIRCTILHKMTPVTLFAGHGENGLELKKVAFGVHTHCLGVEAAARRCELLECWALRIDLFLSGKEKVLTSLPVSLARYTGFQRRILEITRTIPWGATLTYRELACRAHCPDAARAVGSVMRRNDFPLIIPCHRVVRSDGSIGGFSGDTQGLWVDLKRRLLMLESGDA